MSRFLYVAAAVAWATGAFAANVTSDRTTTHYQQAVDAVLALPYDPGYVPQGVDGAFGPTDFPAAFPLTDTTTGTCCTGPVPDQPAIDDLAPPFAEFPAAFELIEFTSPDGTPLHAFAALHPGAPGLVVMHGFNTNGKYSMVRWGAAMHANGYSVIVPDHRDMGREWARGGSYHPDGTRHGQTLGWKEAQDLLAAARWLRDNGATGVGVMGLSEGAQNTILAAGIDYDGVIDTILTFSAPADQSTLAQRNAASTSALLSTVVGNPDICGYLTGVGQRAEFQATPNFMMRFDSAIDTLDGVIGGGVNAPGLHFYTDDDTLVPPWNATMLASRTNTMAEQHTVLLPFGNHAYFNDRYWQQLAALTWFGWWLDPDASHTAMLPTVAAPLNGTPVSSQALPLDGVTRADGDAERVTTDLCPAGTAIGPTALLEAAVDGPSVTLDGRLSYSGWDDHDIAAWTLDAGDGSAPVAGSDVRNAHAVHAYDLSGTYTVTLTVTDDTGRQGQAQTPVTVSVPDTDGDGVPDHRDNCTLVANPSQCDSDGDGFGNHCDADLNNNGVVNFTDLGQLKDAFFTHSGQPDFDASADLNCNGTVNFVDLGMLKGNFFGAPGPAGEL